MSRRPTPPLRLVLAEETITEVERVTGFPIEELDAVLAVTGWDGASLVSDWCAPAAQLHDALYRQGIVSRAECDRLYRVAIVDLAAYDEWLWRDLSTARAWLRWAGLRMVGGWAWTPAAIAKSRGAADATAVLAEWSRQLATEPARVALIVARSPAERQEALLPIPTKETMHA